MVRGGGRPRGQAVPDDFYERIRERLRRRIAERLRFAGRVLDIGCGSCELACFLAEQNGQDVIGVDVSNAGFAVGEALARRVECHKADARHLDFLEDESVDAVVSVHALHEMGEPLEVLKEARRTLRPGGVALVVDFPRDSLAQRLWNEGYFSATEVAEMLERAGLSEVKSRLIERQQLIWAEGRKPGEGESNR